MNDRQLRILLLAPQPFYQPRGTPIAVKMLAEGLAAQGHEVDLLVFHEGESVDMPGVRLLRAMRPPLVRDVPPGFSIKKLLCDATLTLRTAGLMLRNRYDVVHAVEEAGFIAMLGKWLLRRPYVLDMDSSMPEQIADKYPLPGPMLGLMNWMEKLAIRQSVGVVAVCKALEDKAREAAGDTHLIQRLEDVSLLVPIDDGPKLREQLDITGPIALYVGNLESYQGIDLLIAGFAHHTSLCQDSQSDPGHLIIIGGTDEHIAAYREKVESLELGPRIHLVGPRPVEQLSWYLGQADVLVSPRTQGNNTPMKIYSYLDSGRAVLATDLPTHTQVLDSGIAQLSEPTAESLGSGLHELFNDPEKRQQLADAAKQRVAAEYSPQAFARKLGEFYDALRQQLTKRPDHQQDHQPQHVAEP